MKIILISFAFMLMLLPSLAWSQSRIAVLDLDKILQESSAGQSLEKQLQQKRDSFQKEFSSRENNLVNVEKSLMQQKGSLTPEAFEVKRKDFEKEFSETRNLFQKRRNALDKGLNRALDQLRDRVKKITEEIAEKEGYDVVLRRDNVVIVASGQDITDQVLARMNKEIPSVSLTVEE